MPMNKKAMKWTNGKIGCGVEKIGQKLNLQCCRGRRRREKAIRLI
jgi:hypothetical protein